MKKSQYVIPVIEIVIGIFFLMMTVSDIQLGFGLLLFLMGADSLISRRGK